MQNKNKNKKGIDSASSGDTESTQLNSLRILRFKEGELLLVLSEGEYIRLQAVAIHFESLALI